MTGAMVWTKPSGRMLVLPALNTGRHLASSLLRMRLPGSPTRVAGSAAMPSVSANRISSQLLRLCASAASEA